MVIDTVAGMPTVLNPERGLVDRVEWKLLERLRVGAGDSYAGAAVSFALDVGITGDGGVVVLDAGNQRVLRFNAAGELTGTFGGRGAGPGQFRVPLLLEVADDFVYIFDAASNQVSTFSAVGDFLASFPLSFDGLVGTTPALAAGGVGELYAFAEPVPFVRSARDTGSAVLYRLDGSGALIDTVLTFPAATWTPIELPSGRRSYAKARLLPEPKFSARPGAVAVNATASYVIDVRTTAGDPIRRISREYQVVPVTFAIQDSILDRLSQGPGALPRAALERVPFAPIVPAIENLTLDDRGRLWVDVYSQDEPGRVDIFDEEGRFLGPLYLPEPMRVEDVRGDLVCGIRSEPGGHAVAICYRINDS